MPRGQVIGAFRRHFLVQIPVETDPVQAIVRGRKLTVLCGDSVELHLTHGSWVVTEILPRTNCFYRADQWKEKAIAANIDQIVAILAPEPYLDEILLTRWVIAAETQKCPVVLVLNKTDLPQTARLRDKLLAWQELNYPLVEISALTNSKALLSHLQNRKSLLIGQSGVGKSTLINSLVSTANTRTQTISDDNLGRHTTTYTQLYEIPDLNASLIDSPGMREFGLHHLTREKITHAFPDFLVYLSQCRFRNCQHQHEPGCALANAVKEGLVSEKRYLIWQQIVATIK